MAVKFSAFTTRTGTLDASTKIVGYDDPAGTKTNVEFSLATLAANSGIYVTDGTIGTTRIAKVTDTVTFQNAGGTSSLFSLNTDGTFALGHGAASTTVSGVSIGKNASSTGTDSVTIGASSSTVANGIAIGRVAICGVGNSISIGGYSSTAGTVAVALGYDVDLPVSATGSIGIGSYINASAANNITFNATASASVTASTQYQFGAYMTSKDYPDFSVTSNVTKFAFDADSFATITVTDTSNTVIETGESGDLQLKILGDLRYDAATHTFNNGAGTPQATIASLRQECFMMAASDETTDITVAADKVRIQMPYAFTLTEIKASLTTAPTGSGATTVNVYNVTDGDTVINTAALSFAAAAISANSTSFTAGQETIAEDAVIAVDVAAIAGTTGGAGLKVTLIGYQTV